MEIPKKEEEILHKLEIESSERSYAGLGRCCDISHRALDAVLKNK